MDASDGVSTKQIFQRIYEKVDVDRKRNQVQIRMMRMRHREWLNSTILVISLVTSPAVADDEAIAKAKIEEGKRLIKAENYEGALRAFEESHAIRPKSWLLFNMAMCQKALRRYVDAINTFEAYLDSVSTDSKTGPQTQNLARDALEELAQLVGRAKIQNAPMGAIVEVDGKHVATTPLTEPLPLDPGRHLLRIVKPRYEPFEVELIVAPGAVVEVRAELKQTRATIQVACEGENTVVLVDENAVGKCPYTGEVDAGIHEIKVVEPDKRTFSQSVEASAGSTIVVAVDLNAEPRTEPLAFVSDQDTGPAVKRSPALRIAGLTAAGLGVVALAIGGTYTYKWNQQYNVVAGNVVDLNEANQPDNGTEWRELEGTYNDEVRTAERYRTALIVGYTVGGVLVLGGAALFLYDLKKRSQGEGIAVSLSLSGGTVSF